MKPINYDEIFEKAEARRAALEAITPKLQAIYDLWDTLYAAARPINSVNADFEQLDLEAAALLAQSVGVSVSTLGCGLHYLANVMQMLDRPSKDLLEALKPNEEARHLTPLSEQAAPKAAPGEPYQDSTPHLSVGDSSFESWFGSYCPANKGDKQRARDAYAAGMGDPLVRAAPQQEVQEPSHRETVDVVGVRSNGEHVNLEKIAMPPRMKAREIAIEQFGSFKDDDGSDAEMCFGALEYFLEWLIQQGWSKAPQPAPAPLSECLRLLNSFEYEGDEDSQAKAFFKAHINEDWFFHVKNSLELALAAQGGKA